MPQSTDCRVCWVKPMDRLTGMSGSRGAADPVDL
jgi:hypothetical protein